LLSAFLTSSASLLILIKGLVVLWFLPGVPEQGPPEHYCEPDVRLECGSTWEVTGVPTGIQWGAEGGASPRT
jgi:hypothetical protein